MIEPIWGIGHMTIRESGDENTNLPHFTIRELDAKMKNLTWPPVYPAPS